MEMSGAVRKLLNEAAITTEPQALGAPVSGTPLRMVLLGDNKGQFQVVCRRADLFDLVGLNKQMGRQFRLVPRPESVRLLKQAGLRELPAVPALTGWPTMLDRQAGQSDPVVIEPVGEDARLTLTQTDFRKLAGSMEERAFCIPVSDIDATPRPPERDQPVT